MSASGLSGPAPGDPHLARSLMLGVSFGVVAALIGGAGVVFCGLAAYLSLLRFLEPPLAALAVGGGAILMALIVAAIGRALVSRSAHRLAVWVKSSALIALAPHVLGFAARHARLLGLASAAGAAFFAARSKTAH
jgi:hypothetical protein